MKGTRRGGGSEEGEQEREREDLGKGEDWRQIGKGESGRAEGRKGEKKKRKVFAEAEINNRQLDCAEHCYLLWHGQKSSPPSTAITTSPLSAGATGRVTGVTIEIVGA